MRSDADGHRLLSLGDEEVRKVVEEVQGGADVSDVVGRRLRPRIDGKAAERRRDYRHLILFLKTQGDTLRRHTKDVAGHAGDSGQAARILDEGIHTLRALRDAEAAIG